VGFGCSRWFECQSLCSPNLASIKASWDWSALVSRYSHTNCIEPLPYPAHFRIMMTWAIHGAKHALGIGYTMMLHICYTWCNTCITPDAGSGECLFVCYKTGADTAMSLRQERQKSWKTLAKGELPEKPTSKEFAPKATRTAQAKATSLARGQAGSGSATTTSYSRSTATRGNKTCQWFIGA